MKNTENTTSKSITPAQIEAWKKKHGKVFCYESEGKTAYFRRPDRKTIAGAAVLAGSDNLKNKEILILNCFLGGDKELINEDKHFFALSAQFDKTIEIALGELKEV